MYKLTILLLLLVAEIQAQKLSELPAKCGGYCINSKGLKDKMKNVNMEEKLKYEIKFFFLANPPNDYQKMIEKNIQNLNQAFAPNFEFKTNMVGYNIQNQNTNIVDIYSEYYSTPEKVADLFKPSELHTINIYLAPTRMDTSTGQVLLGFTPIYSDWNEGYAEVTPKKDNIIVSFEGLEKGTTLIHEMGHFLSLEHPWQLNYEEKKLLKLEKESDICRNYMNYSCFTDQFTFEQKVQMMFFAKKYRFYLQR